MLLWLQEHVPLSGGHSLLAAHEKLIMEKKLVFIERKVWQIRFQMPVFIPAWIDSKQRWRAMHQHQRPLCRVGGERLRLWRSVVHVKSDQMSLIFHTIKCPGQVWWMRGLIHVCDCVIEYPFSGVWPYFTLCCYRFTGSKEFGSSFMLHALVHTYIQYIHAYIPVLFAVNVPHMLAYCVSYSQNQLYFSYSFSIPGEQSTLLFIFTCCMCVRPHTDRTKDRKKRK